MKREAKTKFVSNSVIFERPGCSLRAAGKAGGNNGHDVGNVEYPISNFECPSGAGAWGQHVCQAIHACLANMLPPGARPTWSRVLGMDIGRWTLDIPKG